MKSTDQIEVWEEDDPLIHFQFTDTVFTSDNGEPTVIPFDLNGATLAFYIKANKNAPDGTAKGTWEVVDAENGTADVQLTASDVGTPGTYWYRVKATRGGQGQTAKAGNFVVRNG